MKPQFQLFSHRPLFSILAKTSVPSAEIRRLYVREVLGKHLIVELNTCIT